MKTVTRLPTRRLVLAACALAVFLLAPTARAEVPSVDAYGGEALVLGTPHHRGGGTTQKSGGSGRSEGSSESGTSSGNSHSSGSSGSSGGGGSSSTGSGSTGGGASTHTGSSGNNGETQPSEASGSGGGNGGSTNKEGGSRPITGNATHVSSTPNAVSGGDILLIFAGLLCIAGIGVLLRVARKPVGDGL